MVEVLAEEKKQRLEIDGDEDVFVSADRVILGHAIVNLLDNAIKYSPDSTRILVRVGRDEAGHASLDVTDEGPGIPSEHQAYVFDRFYRVDKARARANGVARGSGWRSRSGRSERMVERYRSTARKERVLPFTYCCRSRPSQPLRRWCPDEKDNWDPSVVTRQMNRLKPS